MEKQNTWDLLIFIPVIIMSFIVPEIIGMVGAGARVFRQVQNVMLIEESLIVAIIIAAQVAHKLIVGRIINVK